MVQAAFVVLGTGFVALASFSRSFELVSVVAACCLGFGFALGAFEWMYLYLCRGARAARVSLIVSWLLGVVLFTLLALLPSWPRLAAIAVLGVVSAVMELRYLREVRDAGALSGEEDARSFSAKPTNAHDAATTDAFLRVERLSAANRLVPIVAAAAAVGFAYGLSGPLQLSGGGVSTGDIQLLINHLGTVLVASLVAALVLLVCAGNGRINLLPVFLAAFTLDTTAAIALPLVGDWYLPVCAGIFGVVSRVCGMLVLYACATIPGKKLFFRTAPVLLGASGFGLTLGILVGNSLYAGIADGYVALMVITLAVMYVMFMALTITLVTRGLRGSGDGAGSGLVLVRPVQAEEPRYHGVEPGGAFELASDRMVGRYGLSEREVEVMELLAKGRGVSFVAEYLGLSQNTVKAYTKTLYKKLGVHSRDELMNLVEQFEGR